jgi:UrcA family protein
MKTPAGFAAALIVASAVFAAPAAFADQPQKEVNARFAFDPSDPAAKIYDDLNRTARRACELTGTRSLSVVKHEQACMAEMVQDGVNKLGRSDVAAVHNNYFASASAGTRG